MTPKVALTFFAALATLFVAEEGAIPQVADSGVIPNDPYFKYQVTFRSPGGAVAIPPLSSRPITTEHITKAGLDLDITRAWRITTGSKSVVVALLDDGFFYQHEDVRQNIWRNPGETGVDANGLSKETNGVDDDHNGYVDDVMGWDFAFNDPDPDPYVFDGMDNTRIQPFWHSISAMGIIGAKGNNGIGVAGINWSVSMMLLKIGAQGIKRGEFDQYRAERAAKAVRYAVDNGARVINWSGFIDDPRPEQVSALRAAFEYAAEHNVLTVVAAGNSKKDLDDPANLVWPACFETSNNIVVAQVALNGALETNAGNDRISGSNFGPRHVHIAAFGANYTSFELNGRSLYSLAGGTSNATPVVSGVAALILSVRPELTARQLKDILMESAAKLPALAGKVASGGMVDAYAAVTLAKQVK